MKFLSFTVATGEFLSRYSVVNSTVSKITALVAVLVGVLFLFGIFVEIFFI
jgi:hypothetical protein